MQVLFDFSTLYQSNTVFSTPQSSHFSIDSRKFKEWWQRLSFAEKLEISQISSSEILADLSDAINDAILIFQVNRKSQQKSLITSKKSVDEEKGLQTQEFRFNFIGKDVLPDNIAQLISAYHVMIFTPKKTVDTSVDQKSVLKVREEHLDALVGLLETVLTDFGQGQRPVFEAENYSKIYTTISDYSCSKMSVFKGVKSSSVLKLLYKLISISVLIENNLYRSFQQKSLIEASQPSRESIETKLSAKDADSDKEQKSAEYDGTTSASSTNSSHQAHSNMDEPKINIEVFSAEGIPSNFAHYGFGSYPFQHNSGWFQQGEQETETIDKNYMSTYQGFEVGSLDIDFEFVDILMTDYADQEENLGDLLKEIQLEIEERMKEYNDYYLGDSEDTGNNDYLDTGYGYYGGSKKGWRNEKRESSRESNDDVGYAADSYNNNDYSRYGKKQRGRYGYREQIYYMPKAKNGEW